MTCPGCHTRSGSHEPGCPAGALLSVVRSHISMDASRFHARATIAHDGTATIHKAQPVKLPHLNLVQIVRETRAGLAPHRPGTETDGDGIATLLTCAAIQAIRAGVEPRVLAEMFAAIVKIVDEEEPR